MAPAVVYAHNSPTGAPGHKWKREEVQMGYQEMRGSATRCEEMRGDTSRYEEMRGDTRLAPPNQSTTQAITKASEPSQANKPNQTSNTPANQSTQPTNQLRCWRRRPSVFNGWRRSIESSTSLRTLQRIFVRPSTSSCPKAITPNRNGFTFFPG